MKFNHSETFYTTTPIERVFEFATNISKRPEWISSIKRAKLLSKRPIDIGTRFEEDTQFGKMILEFIELEKNKRIRYKTVEGKGAFGDISWDLETENDQTKIHLSFTLYPKGVLKVLMPIVFPLMIKGNLKKEFTTLRNMLNNA